jgi:hypothetical protein
MKKSRRIRIAVAFFWLLFAAAVVEPSEAAKSTGRIRGVLSVASTQSRLLIEGTEIKVRAEEKEDDKEDDNKNDDDETNFPTVSPTYLWTAPPTSRPTTSSPTWSPSVPETKLPTVAPTVLSMQSSSDRYTNSSTVLPTPTPSTSPTSITEDSLRPSVSPTAALNADNSTDSSESSNVRPDPLATSPSPSTRSSAGIIVGVIVAVGSVACLGSLCIVVKRRQDRKNLLRGDTMPEEEEALEEVTSLPPLATLGKMKWSDVFHHSLTNEEKIEVEPACTAKSLFQSTIIEDTEDDDDGSEMQDVYLSSPKRETVVIREVDKGVDHPVPCEKAKGIENENSVDRSVDSYTQAVANLLGCGLIDSNDGEEKKCPDDNDMGSVTSEDLEYMFGTLPSDLLPSTPRTSNVSPEGKMEGSQRASLPSLRSSKDYSTDHLLGPEMEEEGEECDLYWV